MKANSAVLLVIVAMLAFGGGWLIGGSPQKEVMCAEEVRPLFSPGAEPEIARLIESANRSIEVEMYQFSYEPFADGLADAQRRGVEVRVILEAKLDGDDNLVTMERLQEGGIDARWASLSFARTHSKVMIVDGRTVLVGSPNWSYSAMFRNREAAVVLAGGTAVAEFERVFEEDWEKAG